MDEPRYHLGSVVHAKGETLEDFDGPLDVKTSCEKTSGNIKGIVSPIDGEADVLIFPNIESGNAFYKAVSLFSHADMAGLLQGPSCPVVLPSRSDSGLYKY